MKHYLIFSAILMIFLTQCDSVTSPETELKQPGAEKRPQTISKPVLKLPENNSKDQNLTLILSWQEVSLAELYEVQIFSSDTFSDTLINTRTKSNNYQINGLSEESIYYWKIRAVYKDSVRGPWSDSWNFTTTAKPNTKPVRTTLQSPADGSPNQPLNVGLKWSEVLNAKNYRIQIDTEDSFSSPDVDQEIQFTSFSAPDLSNETTYYWRVLPENESGDLNWSETWSFTTETAYDGGSSSNSSADMWVSAYLASYNHYAPPGGNWGNLPTDKIDWEAFTHLFYFSLNAKVDGTLSAIAPYQNMNPDRINAIVSAAHKHNKPVLITIGGWGNYDGFSQAISPGMRSIFITNLTALLKTWGFDGLDLDMEPIKSGDVANYKAFVKELRADLDKITTPLGDKPLLTAATAWRADVFGDLHDYFNQINLMTYDYSGAWQGWVSWHNSALYDGTLTFPGSSKLLPSIDGTVKQFIAAGVPKSKLGIGIDFYGYIWNGGNGTLSGGVTEPNQSWSTSPTVTDNVPYHKIMDQYYQTGNYRWDDQAKAAYLSIDEAGSTNDKFISYDDEKSIQTKFDYVRQKGLGGTIIWELSGGYRKDQPAGEQDNLLQAVKNALR